MLVVSLREVLSTYPDPSLYMLLVMCIMNILPWTHSCI